MSRAAAAALGGLLLVVLLLFGWSVLRDASTVKQDPAVAPSVHATDPVRGGQDAEVTVIEFGDFQCPSCAANEAQLQTLLSSYGQRVRLVWKDFPLTGRHPEALSAAIAARCAAEQGKFWEMHDLLFSRQDDVSAALYPQLAQTLQLDAGAFGDCIAARTPLPLIEQNVTDGGRAGVDGTPYFFVNATPLPNLTDMSQLDAAIRQQLQQ